MVFRWVHRRHLAHPVVEDCQNGNPFGYLRECFEIQVCMVNRRNIRRMLAA
jgi:hypothetical protein